MSKPTALITGSGRKRLGFEIAKSLAQKGYNIAIHFNQSKVSAQENVAELRQFGVDAEAFQADVSDQAAVDRLTENVILRFSSIDVLVTTSSIWKTIHLEDVTADDLLRSFRVNTLGTFLCCRAVGLAMSKQSSGGCIVTIGDALINHPYLDHAAYFVAKGSIPTLTKALAIELASRNPMVRVNCIQPGPVMFPDDLPKDVQAKRTHATLGKIANDPGSVANAVEFIIKTPMIVGDTLTLDGGRNVGLEHRARRLECETSRDSTSGRQACD